LSIDNKDSDNQLVNFIMKKFSLHKDNRVRMGIVEEQEAGLMVRFNDIKPLRAPNDQSPSRI
jgi:hypothetical protein